MLYEKVHFHFVLFPTLFFSHICESISARYARLGRACCFIMSL